MGHKINFFEYRMDRGNGGVQNWASMKQYEIVTKVICLLCLVKKSAVTTHGASGTTSSTHLQWRKVSYRS